jgi:hypothetical protein
VRLRTHSGLRPACSSYCPTPGATRATLCPVPPTAGRTPLLHTDRVEELRYRPIALPAARGWSSRGGLEKVRPPVAGARASTAGEQAHPPAIRLARQPACCAPAAGAHIRHPWLRNGRSSTPAMATTRAELACQPWQPGRALVRPATEHQLD